MFSIDRYREMNLIRVFGVPDFELSPTVSNEPKQESFLPPAGFKWGDSKKVSAGSSKVAEIFKAYYVGGVTYQYSLKTSSYNNLLGSITATPVWHGLISSLTNNGISASFGAPVKPYVTGTEPMQFVFQCFLPIEDCFVTNVENKIKNLLSFVLPSKNNSVKSVLQNVHDGYNNVVDWLFNQDDSIWARLNDAFKGMYDKFISDAYLLDVPLQVKNKTTIWVGNQRIYDVLINNVKITFPPNMYIGRLANSDSLDDGGFYPSYAIVELSCSTNDPVTRNDIDKMKFYPYNQDILDIEKSERVSDGSYQEFQ